MNKMEFRLGEDTIVTVDGPLSVGPVQNSNFVGEVIVYKAAKNDQQKPDLSLLPKVFLEEVAKAFMVGEKKYGRYNYCKGHDASQLIGALMRHATAWFNGEEHDPVDGQHHLGSVGACVAMILRQQELGTLKDNRFKGAKDGND